MPRTDLVERIQGDINASMRAILIDWLVEISHLVTSCHGILLWVAEEYSLVPETLFLTVNYIDRYLSGNVIQRQRLQLLGVACMIIAAKYEEICAPQVEEFCYVADNTYFKKEVLQMESSVLNYLKFEMSAPTAGCFLTRFVRAAQGINEMLQHSIHYWLSVTSNIFSNEVSDMMADIVFAWIHWWTGQMSEKPKTSKRIDEQYFSKIVEDFSSRAMKLESDLFSHSSSSSSFFSRVGRRVGIMKKNGIIGN
ncbi:cyclin-A1-1-like [Camellia sinensis]|uniref:cyclin-A1-1-like n=1 Tax=Camellia sinensis TaxID=4442 RepID=UPI00103571C7|nr:cyclin-A1-1-like [Camellia sinensis]